MPAIKSAFTNLVMDRFLVATKPTDSIAIADKILLEQSKVLDIDLNAGLPNAATTKKAKNITKDNREGANKYDSDVIVGMVRYFEKTRCYTI